MDRDRHILSGVPYPITRTSQHMPEWLEESVAMPRRRDEGASMPEWREEHLPARPSNASDEWDYKWIRPLFIPPQSQAPQSQPAKAESAAERHVVEIPAKRAKHANASAPILPTSQVPPLEPAKTVNVRESMGLDAMPLRFLRWLFRATQCRAKRYSTPNLVAYYFTGGAPHSFQVGDMSSTGLYLLTPERWALCTLIQMTLQKVGSSGSPKDSICVLSELVRFDEKGAGFNFVLPDYQYLSAYGLKPEEVPNRQSLMRFMWKTGVRAR